MLLKNAVAPSVGGGFHGPRSPCAATVTMTNQGTSAWAERNHGAPLGLAVYEAAARPELGGRGSRKSATKRRSFAASGRRWKETSGPGAQTSRTSARGRERASDLTASRRPTRHRFTRMRNTRAPGPGKIRATLLIVATRRPWAWAADHRALALCTPVTHPDDRLNLGSNLVAFKSNERCFLSCESSSTAFGPQTIWTKKDNASWLQHAIGAPESAADLLKARGSIENRSSSGLIKTRVIYRTSNDGASWDAWASLYANGANELTNDGTVYGPSYIDLAATVAGKQLIQWGVEAINTSGTATELATVIVKIDRKKG